MYSHLQTGNHQLALIWWFPLSMKLQILLRKLMHTDDTIETDYLLIDTEPLDIYSRQVLYDEDVQDTVIRNSIHYSMTLNRI